MKVDVEFKTLKAVLAASCFGLNGIDDIWEFQDVVREEKRKGKRDKKKTAKESDDSSGKRRSSLRGKEGKKPTNERDRVVACYRSSFKG